MDTDWLEEIHRNLRAARGEIQLLRNEDQSSSGQTLQTISQDLEAVISKLASVIIDQDEQNIQG